jgi:beta-glucosidase
VTAPPFRDPSLPLRERAEDLLARLTGPEKITMLHQRSPVVARLGLAEFWTGTEALHGAAWNGPATVFPQAVGIGATWDPGLVTEIGVAVAREVRALHDANPTVSLNLWAPVVNLLRDPRWGRNEEGYSEDPRLTAATAIAYCRGLRGDDPAYLRTAPTLKHFLGYNNEDGRDTTSSVLPPRVLHEYELPAFRDPVEAGGACGVMPAYNLLNGRPCHVSPYLALARSWTDEELLICSDAGAPSNLVDTEHYFADHPAGHAAALRAGVDSFTDHEGDPAFTAAQVTGALARGLITMADVDRAVRRKLLIRLRLGEFDAGGGPFASDGAGMLNCTAHQRLARRAARRAIVLLKNDDATLPLRPGPGSRIAVIGPLSEMVCEDWYSGTLPYQVTAADGLREALGAVGVEVTGREGFDRVAVRATSRDGLLLGEFDVADWGNDIVTLRAAADGRYLSVRDDGSLAADAGAPNGWVVHETFAITRLAATSAGGALVLLRSTATGRYLGIDPDTGTLSAAAPTAAEAEPLSWDIVADGTGLAAAAARAARAAVVVVGNHPLINGRETQDRVTLALPPAQERLIRAVHAANPRTVVVIVSSYPYAVTWAQANVPAIVWTCHGGQEAGHALADVLLGEHAPSGRLPQTWYRRDADLPDIGDYDIIKSRRTYLYFDGEPLYPFGHGLSYTSFSHTGLRLNGASRVSAVPGDTVSVSLRVANTGLTAGEEVVQLYARARQGPPAPGTGRLPVGRPRRQLVGFARVALGVGAASTVEMPLPTAALACWDVETHQMAVQPGDYEVMAGSSSHDIRQTAILTVSGPAPSPRRLTGREVAAADFDDYESVTLVDATRESGDAVASPERGGWILFRDAELDLPRGGSIRLRVARARPGRARVELWRASPDSKAPLDGVRIGQVTVNSTGGDYAWAEATAALTASPGGLACRADLYLAFIGELRLRSFRILG